MSPSEIQLVRRALVNHVLSQLGEKPNFPSTFDLNPYLQQLPTGNAKGLTQILTALDAGHSGHKQPPVVLDTTSTYILRGQRNEESPADFLAQWHGIDPGEHFEAWVSAIQQAALGVLGQRHEEGVSLYHEFKLLSAMVHATLETGLDTGFTLVSGDFPGIQRTIYTIGSDGATKGVRGRSFFLQLLAECVVRRLLMEVGDLPITNAIYVAGGNFLLLVPIGTEAVVEAICTEINQRLLDLFYGDIALVTATLSVDTSLVSSTDGFRDAFSELKRRESEKKLQPFAGVAAQDWAHLFATHGIGGNETCIVCQREPLKRRDWHDIQQAQGRGETWACEECRAFNELADALARSRNDPYLVFYPEVDERLSGYAQKLAYVTGWTCAVKEEASRSAPVNGITLRLNRLALEPQPEWVQGFRFLAVRTPLTDQQDVSWWENHGTSDERLYTGSIRNFTLLAAGMAVRQGRKGELSRLGVLRMDVDSLGKVFREQLNPMTLTRLMAASDALTLFFAGYLSELCHAFEMERDRPNSLYLLYSGGDDLFIVGEWDLMPWLAQRIRDEFSAYTNQQLTVSAGVALVPEHYPFYRAAELTKQALDEGAKQHLRVGDSEASKDAISFLETVFPWRSGESWQLVVGQYRQLRRLSERLGSDTVTRNVLNIYQRWWTDRRVRQVKTTIYYGPYMWLAAYQMARLANECKNPEEKQAIENVQRALLDPQTIELSGPTARWAELARRAQVHDYEGENP